MRLAAGYSGRPLHLIGPGVYPEWLRLVRVLLAVVVPISVVGNLVARLFVEDLATTDIGSLVGSSIALAVTVALHVVFWTTLVFVVLERTGHASLDTWTPDQLPDTGGTGRVGFGETAASVVFLVLVALALVWQQTSSPITSAGEVVPVLDPALWSGWIPWLLVVLVAQAVLAIVVFRHGRWTRRLAAVSVLLDLAFAVPLLLLLRSGDLFNEAFVDRLVAEGWADAERDLPRPRRSASSWCSSGASSRRCATRAPRTGTARDGSGVERAHDLAERRGVAVDVGAGRGRAHERHVVERRHEDAAVAHREVQVGVEVVVVRGRRLLAAARRRPGEPVLRAGAELAHRPRHVEVVERGLHALGEGRREARPCARRRPG